MDEEQTTTTAPQQDPYLAFALRWWWLIILGAILGAVAAFGYTKFGPISQQSVAQVQVPPQTTTNPNANTTQAAAATTNYTAEATTSQIFSLVSKELAGRIPLSTSDLILLQQEGRIDIRAPKGTNFITITVIDSDPGRARLLADTFATVFVRDVNSRASAQIDARQQLLEGQIDITGQRYLTSRLNQRQEELQASLANQRTSLLQLQSSYQQEVQRQAEADRLAGVNGAPSPQVVATRNQWLETINSQIAQVQNTLRETNTQLDTVRAQLAALPGSTDPSVSAAFATAYGQQLQNLTQEYAQLQLDAPTARVPLVRYGVASDPLPTSGVKKFLMVGAGAGLALAAALGFGIDFLRRRRQQKLDAALADLATDTAATPVVAPVAQTAPATPVVTSAAQTPVDAPIGSPAPHVAAATTPLTVGEPRDLPTPAETTENATEEPPRRSDELVYLVERARQRRVGATGHANGSNGLNGHHKGDTGRLRPLPTHDDEPPLRKAE